MAKIKNMGTATMRFGEGVIITGSAGTDTPTLVVTGSTVISGSGARPALDVYGSLSGEYVAVIDNDQNSSGHVLKLLTDGNGSGSRVLEMIDGDGDTIFRARADGRFGFGPDGVSSMGAGTFVVGIDNSSHTSDIAISKRLQHLGDSNTYIDFEPDTITLAAGGRNFIKIEEDTQDQISVGLDSSYGSDVFLSVSGSINTGQDLSVFGGDVLVSGSLNVSGYTLPTSDGSANQVIKTDGSGNLSFTNQAGGSGSPGGSDTHIQINNGGSFGGVDNLTYDGDTLFISGSMQLVGEEKINDPTYANGDQANRSFTLKRHYDISLSPNTWTDVISWRPYITGGTTEPTHFYTAVAFKMEIFGHQNGVNNGYRSRKGMVSYEGSSAANAYATDDTLGSGPISTQVSRSGWVTTLQVNANSGGAQAFRGGVYVEIHFPRGAGTNGEQIYWSVT